MKKSIKFSNLHPVEIKPLLPPAASMLEKVFDYPSAFLAFHGANFNRINIPGMAIIAHARKKISHPTFLARKPVGAEASTLGTPMRLLSSAY
jgi:hypothetical protein